jgi:hypothetical protein
MRVLGQRKFFGLEFAKHIAHLTQQDSDKSQSLKGKYPLKRRNFIVDELNESITHRNLNSLSSI